MRARILMLGVFGIIWSVASYGEVKKLASQSPFDSVSFIKLDPTHAYTPINRIVDPVPFPPVFPLHVIDPDLRPGKIFGMLPIGGWQNPGVPNNYAKDVAAVFVNAAGGFIPPGPRTTAPPNISYMDIPEDFYSTGPNMPVSVEVPEDAYGIVFAAAAGTYRDNIDPDNDYGVQITVSTISLASPDKKPTFSGVPLKFNLVAVNSLPNMSHSFLITQQPTHGWAGLSASGEMTYVSNPGYFGTDKIKVKVTDSGGVYSIFDIVVNVKENMCANAPAGIPCDPSKGWQNPMTEEGTPNNSCAKNQTSTTKPVNLCTGNLWHQERDFFLEGRTRESGILVSRTYVTRPADAASDFGPGWHFGFKSRLKLFDESIDSSAIWVDELGGPWQFTNNGDGTFQSPKGFHGHLVRTEDRFLLTTQNRTVYTFDLNGKLTQKSDRWGEPVTFTYDPQGNLASVAAPKAGQISIVRNSNGRITAITRERDNLTWTYSYDSDGRLVEARDFSGLTHKYTYNTLGLLSSITDKIGRTETYTYYPNGRAWQQFEPEGGVRTFSYTPDGEANPSTSLLDIDGILTTHFFDDSFRTIRVVNGEGEETRQTWNEQGEIASVTDEYGAETLFQYDENGNQTGIKRPGEPAFSTVTYDLVWNVPTLVTPLVGAPTVYTVNPENGDVTQVSRTAGPISLALAFTRDQFGNVLSINNGLATYSDQRNGNGLLTQKFDLHNPETITYDSRFRVATRTFQSGRTISYTYDDYDRVTREDDSHGPDLITSYDAIGRVLTRTVTDGTTNQTTTYVWDGQDRLVRTTDPEGKSTSYKYDAKRVLRGPSEIIDPAGRTTKIEYDRLGRKVKSTDPKGATTKWTYERSGKVFKVTDAAGKDTEYFYDSRGRLSREHRPSNIGPSPTKNALLYTYDDLDRVTQIEHLPWASRPSRYERFEYDAFDRMVRSTLWNGSTMEEEKTFTHSPQLDADSLLSANSSVVNYSFTKAAVPPFSSTSFSVQAGEGGNPKGLIEDTFTIQRDVTGEISSISGQATGQVVRRKHDAAGRMTAAKTGNLAAVISFDGFGRKKEINFTSGVKGTFAYDILNRIENISWNNGIEQSLAYNKAGNIAVMERENGTYNLGYDEVDQLTSSKHKAKRGVENYTRSLGYDQMGNRVVDSKNKKFSYYEDFLIENDTHRFSSDQNGFGELIEETEKSTGKTKAYSYRPDGRAKGVTGTNVTVTYHYDAFDRKIATEVLEGENHYMNSVLYEEREDKILLGKNGAGQIYKYLEGQGIGEHLGEVGPSGAKAYTTDHLGSVLNSEAAGASHSFGLFGESGAQVELTPSTSPVIYGYGGYQFDAASGQYFMGPRTYDPNTGRWNQQDPIGLKAEDANYYRYVFNNPLRYTDPSGLKCQRTIDKGIILSTAGLAIGVVSPPAGAVCGGVGIGLIISGYIEDCPEPTPPKKEEPGKKEPEKKETPPPPKDDGERILG